MVRDIGSNKDNNSCATCFLCLAHESTLVSRITEKPRREIELGIPPQDYVREIRRCSICDVFFNCYAYDFDNLYQGAYNLSVYKNKILDEYLKIRKIPEDKSINKQRVNRVVRYLAENNINLTEINILDVGSGLCVFAGELKDRGFKCHCIEVDKLSVNHALENVKVDSAFCGSLMNFTTDIKFDLISFNRVLEHVQNPVAILEKAKEFLSDRGLVYIELPDGLGAMESGGLRDREEFFIDHYTIFNSKSLEYLASEAGFRCVKTKTIHDPADKYTLYAFLKPELIREVQG